MMFPTIDTVLNKEQKVCPISFVKMYFRPWVLNNFVLYHAVSILPDYFCKYFSLKWVICTARHAYRCSKRVLLLSVETRLSFDGVVFERKKNDKGMEGVTPYTTSFELLTVGKGAFSSR